MTQRVHLFFFLSSLLALGCGGGAVPVDGSSDAHPSKPDGAQDSAARNLDASAGASSCAILVWVFGGCTSAAIDECQREYATFPASMQADVDTYAVCLHGMVFGAVDAAITGGPDAGCPTSSNSLNRWYMHGGCEGNAAQVYTDLGNFDPCGGTAVSCATSSGEADCASRTFQCSWTSGACMDNSATPTPCSQVPGACATVPGCTGSGFPACGGPGQPSCFFSQALPGGTGL
jgi:hypothetical protein